MTSPTYEPGKSLGRVFIGDGEYVRADEAVATVMALQKKLYAAEGRLLQAPLGEDAELVRVNEAADMIAKERDAWKARAEAAEARIAPRDGPWTLESSIYEGFSTEIWADARAPGKRTVAIVRDYQDAIAILSGVQAADCIQQLAASLRPFADIPIPPGTKEHWPLNYSPVTATYADAILASLPPAPQGEDLGSSRDHDPGIGSALDFVREVGRWEHSADEGFSGEDEWDGRDALDSLIAKARDIDTMALRQILAAALSNAKPAASRSLREGMKTSPSTSTVVETDQAHGLTQAVGHPPSLSPALRGAIEVLREIVVAAQDLRFTAYPAHGSGFVTTVKGDLDRFILALSKADQIINASQTSPSSRFVARPDEQGSDGGRLNELEADEMFDAGRQLNAALTREEFDIDWVEFQRLKAKRGQQ